MNHAQPRRNLLLAQGTSKKHFRNKLKYEVSAFLIKSIIFQCYAAVPSMAPAIRAPNAKTKVEVLRETVQQGNIYLTYSKPFETSLSATAEPFELKYFELSSPW